MQLEKIRAGSECKGAGKQAVIEYRQEKLSVNLKKLGRMKIYILGAGAVGSHIAEALYQHGPCHAGGPRRRGRFQLYQTERSLWAGGPGEAQGHCPGPAHQPDCGK